VGAPKLAVPKYTIDESLGAVLGLLLALLLAD
jgi:hypothetical protein